jgi:hypothetical protein
MAVEKKETKTRRYYAPYFKYSFYCPVIGEDGKPVLKRHSITQALMYSGGKPQMERTQKLFLTVSANISKGLLCMYETADPVEIDILDGLVKDPTTRVMDEDGYAKYRDPKTYGIQKELDAERKKGVEKDDEILKLQKQIEELTKPPTVRK